MTSRNRSDTSVSGEMEVTIEGIGTIDVGECALRRYMTLESYAWNAYNMLTKQRIPFCKYDFEIVSYNHGRRRLVARFVGNA